jgi:hypothetical protein
MMTDVEFWQHINSVNANEVLLVTVEYMNPSTQLVGTLYFSTKKYITSPTDLIPNTCFEDILDVDLYTLTTSVSLPNPTDNKLSVAVNWTMEELSFLNEGGKYDFLLNCIFDGYKVNIYIGDLNFPMTDFRQIKSLLCGNISTKDEFSLKIQIVSMDGVFNCETQRQIITTGVSKGNPVPLAYGFINRAGPVLLGINPKTGFKRYKLNQYRIKSILNVKDNGINISPSNIVTYLDVGEFELLIEPSGVLTVDFEGTVDDSGTFLNTAGKIVKHLIQEKAQGITIDANSLTYFESKAPATLGVYLTQRMNLNEMLIEVLNSVLGFMYFKASNVLYLGVLELPKVPDPVVLTKEFVQDGGLSMDDTFILPLANLKVSYAKNYTPSDTSALSLPEVTRQAIKLPYSTYNAGVIYDEVIVTNISKISTTNAIVSFSSTSLASMILLSNVSVGDYLNITLGTSTVNQGYHRIVAVTAATVEIHNPKAVSEGSLGATCAILKTSPIYAQFKNPISAEVRETFLTNMADAKAQSSVLLSIYNKIRRTYTLKISNINVSFSLFQHIKLQYPRYSMNDGVDAWVISTPDTPLSSFLVIKVLV